MKIKIIIVDDHPLFIKGLQQIFANSCEIELLESYCNGKELLAGRVLANADVVLLDIHMPGPSGDELAEVIKRQYPETKIIALTNEDNVFYIKNMLKKGADGYVLKTTTEDTLLTAIRIVFSGKQYLESDLTQKVLRDTLNGKKDLSAKPELSRREKEVLRLIAMDMTSKQIAEKLFVSKRTVDYYRICLTAKLGVKSTAALVKKGMQLGYI